MSERSAEAACRSLNTKGHVFAVECAMEALILAEIARNNNRELADYAAIFLEWNQKFATTLFEVAARFYKSPKVELPGYVILSIGLIDVLGSRMSVNPGTLNVITGQPYLDDDFAGEIRVPIDQLLDSPSSASASLIDDLEFGFDL